ncbi:MAG: AarF/ABC1/UbiB kinase family protein [bacterium]|nr:AarF/ABC1/UbiB kinase family protein [bacterium]
MTDADTNNEEAPRQESPDALLGRSERVRRATRTGAAIAQVYLGYKGLHLLDHGVLRGVVRRARHSWHKISARTLHGAAEDLGGVLLKAGQFLGARADVLPPAYIDRLEHLQDRVRPNRYPVVRRVIEEELGAPPEQVFARFWRRPIASASLAQVHRATLFDGREVAVKVQRPEVEAAVRADLRNLRVATRAIERIEGTLGYAHLLDQLEENLKRELDFGLEASSALRIADNFADGRGIRIPKIVPSLTRRRLLVTEYIPGIKVTDTRRLQRANIDPSAIVARLLNAFAEQILEHGFFHGDPHPGNLLVVPTDDGEFELVFLDFGLMQEVPADFREQVMLLATGLLSRNVAATSANLRNLGLRTSDPESGTVECAAELLVALVKRGSEDGWHETTREIGQQLADLLRDDPVASIPPHLWLLGRVFGLITGVAHQLGTPLDLVKGLLPWLARQS